MKELIVSKNEAGQRLDKLLLKYLNKANYGFLQKMLRKKNIVLNDKKADGHEILKEHDSVKIWFSDETLAKFAVHEEPVKQSRKAKDVPGWFHHITVVYEDADVVIINKPAGILSQKAAPSDVSLVEWLIWYMKKNNELTEEQLQSFHPAICNRLDRNTSGLVVCGKSLPGLQFFNEQFRGHTLDKYYHCVVSGVVKTPSVLEGYLLKNESTNTVTLYKEQIPGSVHIKTAFRPLCSGSGVTLLEVQLFTGKTHQIRSHLASTGHPILGDPKYGDPKVNAFWKKKAGVTNQMLHAYRLEMHETAPAYARLENKQFIAEKPPVFAQVETIMERNPIHDIS